MKSKIKLRITTAAAATEAAAAGRQKISLLRAFLKSQLANRVAY